MDLPLFQRGILLVVTHTQVPRLVRPTLSCQVSARVALTPIPPVIGEALALTLVLPLRADLTTSPNNDLNETRSFHILKGIFTLRSNLS